MSPAAARMTATELLGRLQRHYIKPGESLAGGVFLPEVTHGSAGGRRADALYVGFVRSRGLHLVGHEIKVARSDWLHELDQIDKAEVWASQCHAWYAVAPDTSIIRPEELPHGWGLLVVDPATKTRLRVVQRALVDEAVQPSWTTTHSILKRIDTLRALAVRDARDAVRAEVDEELARLRTVAAQAQLTMTDQRLRDRADNLEHLLAELSRIIGLDIVEGAWSTTGSITLDEVRIAFAEFLRARRSSTEAIGRRLDNLRGTRVQLERALEAVSAAEQAIAQHALNA